MAGQRDFDVPFPYISTAHVSVMVNGNLVPALEWVSQSRLRLGFPLVGGEQVVIERNTPIEDQLVKFQNGAILTDDDLNTAVKQLLYKQQEITGLYDGSLRRARIRILEASGVPVTPDDIANQVAAIAAESALLDDLRNAITDLDANGVLISNHSEAIITQAQQITDVTAETNTLGTALTDLRSDHEALVGVVNSLASLEDGTGLAAVIQTEQDARIDGDNALAATISLIGAKSGDSTAFILDLNRVKVSPTESLSQRLTAIKAATDGNAAAITTEQTARANGDAAEASARTALAATLRSETSALIVQEQEARADAISAEAASRNSLGVAIRGELSAAINSEQSARITQDNVFAQNFTLMGARNAGGTAWVLDLNKVQVGGGTTMASRLSGIDTSLANNSAAIASEQTARTSADSALSQRVDTMGTTVNGNTATLTTLQQTVNGISARYGVALDVNGYITGFVQNNNGATGTFDIVADKFRVTMPGVAPRTVFTVDANGVYLNGNLRVDGNLIVNGTLPTPAIVANAISNSAYWQTNSGGGMGTFPQYTWVDFDTTTSGGGGASGGGTGGGGSGGLSDWQANT